MVQATGRNGQIVTLAISGVVSVRVQQLKLLVSQLLVMETLENMVILLMVEMTLFLNVVEMISVNIILFLMLQPLQVMLAPLKHVVTPLLIVLMMEYAKIRV